MGMRVGADVTCSRCDCRVGTVWADTRDEAQERALGALMAHACKGAPEAVPGEVEEVRRLVEARRSHLLSLERVVARVREIHQRDPYDPRGRYCVSCEQTYPCETIEALDTAADNGA